MESKFKEGDIVVIVHEDVVIPSEPRVVKVEWLSEDGLLCLDPPGSIASYIVWPHEVRHATELEKLQFDLETI